MSVEYQIAIQRNYVMSKDAAIQHAILKWVGGQRLQKQFAGSVAGKHIPKQSKFILNCAILCILKHPDAMLRTVQNSIR